MTVAMESVSQHDGPSLPFYPTTEVTETSSKILDIIFEYALIKFSDSIERLALGKPKFLLVITRFVATGSPVEMCLPAFPFKSANKVSKVFGILPDKAEELALERLENMCTRIRNVYSPGAKLTIISDGLVYNDLLGISDRDTWAYGEALRTMADRRKFDSIGFSRLRDLVDFNLPEKLEEITYVANATNFRRFLFNKYGKDDLDIDHEIVSNPDTQMTYLGYRRFLESDLRYIFPLGGGRSNRAYKRDVMYLAKQMLIRGHAFAGAVKSAFPRHLRLSIHQSTGEHKISMSLLNTRTGFTTPWHCSVAMMTDGEWISGTMGDFQNDPSLEIIYEDGRPSYFQAKARATAAHEESRNDQYPTERLHENTAGLLSEVDVSAEEDVKMVEEQFQYQSPIPVSPIPDENEKAEFPELTRTLSYHDAKSAEGEFISPFLDSFGFNHSVKTIV